jgi:hypothetical protein
MAKLGTCGSCGAWGSLGAMPDGYIDKDGRKVVYRGPAERAAQLCTLCLLQEMNERAPDEPLPGEG